VICEECDCHETWEKAWLFNQNLLYFI
jgi:hypothetical protein